MVGYAMIKPNISWNGERKCSPDIKRKENMRAAHAGRWKCFNNMYTMQYK